MIVDVFDYDTECVFNNKELLCSSCSGRGTGLVCSRCILEMDEEEDE